MKQCRYHFTAPNGTQNLGSSELLGLKVGIILILLTVKIISYVVYYLTHSSFRATVHFSLIN